MTPRNGDSPAFLGLLEAAALCIAHPGVQLYLDALKTAARDFVAHEERERRVRAAGGIDPLLAEVVARLRITIATQVASWNVHAKREHVAAVPPMLMEDIARNAAGALIDLLDPEIEA